MKNTILVLLVLISSVCYCQDRTEKNLGDFTSLKVYDLINVKMIKSSSNRVVISGKNKNSVQVINKNGKLKIRMTLEASYDGHATNVELYYTSIDLIDANEGAKITFNEAIEQYEIDLKTQEGATITGEIKATYANLRAVTGGIITVKGSSKHQKVLIYTGGVLNGKSLETEYAEVSLNAQGEAHINATERAKIKIKGGGYVFIYGNPKQVDENTVLGGVIKRM